MTFWLSSFVLIESIPKHLVARDWYFSTSGNDGNDGLSDATAKQSLAHLNTLFSGGSIGAGDHIYFKRGQSFYGSISITQSGSSGTPITLTAYGSGADPIITGNTALTWVSYATVGSGKLWRSNESVGTSLANRVNVVTANGYPVCMARWPSKDNGNGGYNTVNGDAPVAGNGNFAQLTTTASELTGMPTIYFYSANPVELVFKPDKFRKDRATITAWDGSTFTFDSLLAKYDPPTDGKGWFIQNDSNILRSTTATRDYYWFHNLVTGKLEMYLSGSTAPANIQATTIQTLVTNGGSSRSWIVFDGLHFVGSNDDMVDFTAGSSSQNNTFQNCELEDVGHYGINYQSKLGYMSVINCKIHHTMSTPINNDAPSGGTGGFAGSTGLSKMTFGGTFLNNEVYNVAQLEGHGQNGSGDANGINLNDSASLCQGNYIHNIGYCGIAMGEQDNIKVRNNKVDTFCNVLDDGGGIYSYTGGGTSTTSGYHGNKGREISGNTVLHGMGSYGSGGALVAGAAVATIYMDRGASDVWINGNHLGYSEKGIFINYSCRRDSVTNNLIFSCLKAVVLNTRLASGDTTRQITVKHNIMYADSLKKYCLVLFSLDGDVFTKFGTIDSNRYSRPLDNTSVLDWTTNPDPNSSSNHYLSLATWKTTFSMYDQHSEMLSYTYANKGAQDAAINIVYNSGPSSFTYGLFYQYLRVLDVAANDVLYASGSTTVLPYTSQFLVNVGALVIIGPSGKIKLRGLKSYRLGHP